MSRLTLEQEIERDTRNAISFGRAMDHIFSAFERKPVIEQAPPLQIYLRRVDDDAIIAQQFVRFVLDRSLWIDEKIMREFECSQDDVSSIESESGDFITVEGNPVAYVEVR